MTPDPSTEALAWKCENCGWTNLGYVTECDGCGEPKEIAELSRRALAARLSRYEEALREIAAPDRYSHTYFPTPPTRQEIARAALAALSAGETDG